MEKKRLVLTEQPLGSEGLKLSIMELRPRMWRMASPIGSSLLWTSMMSTSRSVSNEMQYVFINLKNIKSWKERSSMRASG